MNYTAALKYILCIKMTFIKFYNYILQKIIFFDKYFYPTNFLIYFIFFKLFLMFL